MINIRANGNKAAYGIKHFALDTAADMGELNRTILTPGSTAFIISSSEYYMLNGSRNWIKINPSSIGGGGSDDPGLPEEDYDGGSIDGSGFGGGDQDGGTI